MNFSVLGISHKTASVDIREKFFLKPVERELLLNELKNNPVILESVIISTCNRTEIYAHMISDSLPEDYLLNILFHFKKVKKSDKLSACFYEYRDEKCVDHLLRVTAGLESLIVGEKQILGQIKDAVDMSRGKRMLTQQFNILMNLAIRCGKKAQTETDISCGGSSVSWAAVKMAEKELAALAHKSVLIIGAGKMSSLTADQLKNKKIGQLYIMNRTKQKALLLADRLGAKAISFLDIKEVLSQVDVCICSASAPHYLISRELIEQVMKMRSQKKLVCIDISTPRNIDPQVAEAEGVTLLTIDDLDRVVQDNIEKRKSAVSCVERIIQNKISELNHKLSYYACNPAV